MSTTSSNSHAHTYQGKPTTSIGHQHTFTETSHPADSLTDAEVAGLRALLAAPVPAPTPPPIVLPFPGFAKADAAVAAGGTVDVPPGTYKEMFTATKPGVTWNMPKGVVIDLTGLPVPLQQGGARWNGADCKLTGMARITGSVNGGIQLDGDRITATYEVDHCGQEGNVIHGSDVLVKDHLNHDNNLTGAIYDSDEQGAGKAHALNLVFDGGEVWNIGNGAGHQDTGGKGLWWDQWYPVGTPSSSRMFNPGAEVRNMRIHDCWFNGIMYEVSRGAKFYDNVLYRCGSTVLGSGFWGAAVLISSSQDVEVYNNVFGYNQSHVRVVLQDRGDQGPGITSGVTIHGNTFIGASKNDFAFDTDWTAAIPTMFSTASGNVAYANKFGVTGPKVYWKPQGTLTTIAGVDTLPGGGGNIQLTAQQVADVIAATGIAP